MKLIHPRRGTRRTVLAVTAVSLLAGCGRGGPGELATEERYGGWASYEGGPEATHYSALDQIDRSNATHLEVAWSYPIGDDTNAPFNPIVIDSMMYLLGAGGAVTAIHAGTGRELWSNPLAEVSGGIMSRGIMCWESEDRSDRRLLTSKGNRLHALDALTGRPVPSFGENGSVDLREGLGRDPRSILRAQSGSPGRVFEDLVILGSATGESYSATPGHIRAYDARTGEMRWIFHTIPHPGEHGYESWPPDAWQRVGAANAWGGLSMDEERGIVYVPLGSASYDFYGADRHGANLFANSLVALNARTGERIWHYQTIHHDLWDYDLTATPTLLTVNHGGRMVDIVAQASKQGFLYVFDRVTGEPLWPIEERPVPPSTMPGEQAWPTQPHPTWPPPFAIQSFTLGDVNPYIPPAERDSVMRRLREIRSLGETVFMPPDTLPTMQMPGNAGGANWGSTAADPAEGSFFVVTRNLPTVLQLSRVVPGAGGNALSPADRGQLVYRLNCQSCHLEELGGSPPMIPSLVGVTERLSDDEIRTVIHAGRGNMPGFVDLSPQEVSGVIAYLENPGAVPPPPPAPAEALSEGEPAGPLRYQTGYGYFSVSGGMYARKPPFMTMTKYDLNTGEIAWQVPVGEVRSLVERGITDNTGAANPAVYGGPAVTAGGLIFLVTDTKLRVYDVANGAEITTFELPTGGRGIPTVYEYAGRQYVVVAAGSGRDRDYSRTAYVAYALPEG